MSDRRHTIAVAATREPRSTSYSDNAMTAPCAALADPAHSPSPRKRDRRAFPMAMCFAVLGLVAIGTTACRHGSTVDIATLAASTDRALWESGNKALQKKQYTAARQYFGRLIENFPGSPNQPLARLARADAYFREGGTENYVLAANDYREFTTLYPSHPRADYAQLQIAECYFKQKLRPDRDQTTTLRALEEAERLLTTFPSSPLVEQARTRVNACRWSLARGEYQVGMFYQRRQSYRAAIQRYEGLLKDYPEYTSIDEVMYRLAGCLTRVGRVKEALPLLARLDEEHPKSQWKEPAARLRQKAQAVATPSPSPTPSAGVQ